MLNARNDPFCRPGAARSDLASAAVTLEFPAEGGHVGFASGGFPGRLDWLPQRLLDFCPMFRTDWMFCSCPIF